MTEPCAPCLHLTDEMSEDDRFDYANIHTGDKQCDTCPFKWDWMPLIGLSYDRATLANARMLWLSFQSLFPKAGERPCLAMPDDPEPQWWPVNTVRIKRVAAGLTLFERVKSAVAVEDIAERLTELRGNSVLKGKCPLHNEQNGEAFAVYKDTQTWRCFGSCNVGGDVIALIQECMERDIEWQK